MRKSLLSIFLLFILFLSACGEGQESGEGVPAEESVAVTDSLGREISVRRQPERVAALMGSYAETWLLSGGADSLTAVTEDAFTERDLELADDITVLGYVHDPDIEALFAAAPDFVLLSAEIDTHTALLEQLDRAGIPAAAFRVDTFSDYLSMLKTCTEITGQTDLYAENGLSVQSRMDAVLRAVDAFRKAAPDGETTAPKVLLLRASSTAVKARNSGNVAGNILRDLGCVNIADSESGILEDLQMEAVLAAEPDFIFALLQGSQTEKARQSLEDLFSGDPAWQTLSAVREKRVHILDKRLFHYKPNARWGESYEVLARILYPDAFPGA